MPLPWYALGVRTYDPALERFLQPDPASQSGLPAYVYAHDDPLDYADPSGLAAVPLNCGNTTTGTAAALGCEAQASAADQQAQTNAALWAPANFLLLDPLRNTFGPGKSLFDRGLGLLALAPFVGWAGHGIGLGADVARGVAATHDAADAISLAEDGGLAGAGGNWSTIGEATDARVVQQSSPLSCVSACGEMLLRSRGVMSGSESDIIGKIGAPADPRDLPEALNALDESGGWRGGVLDVPQGQEAAIIGALNRSGSWAASLKSFGTMLHMVVVDGLDDAGNLVIRDPYEGTLYAMTPDDFAAHWQQHAVFRP